MGNHAVVLCSASRSSVIEARCQSAAATASAVVDGPGGAAVGVCQATTRQRHADPHPRCQGVSRYHRRRVFTCATPVSSTSLGCRRRVVRCSRGVRPQRKYTKPGAVAHGLAALRVALAVPPRLEGEHPRASPMVRCSDVGHTRYGICTVRWNLVLMDVPSVGWGCMSLLCGCACLVAGCGLLLQTSGGVAWVTCGRVYPRLVSGWTWRPSCQGRATSATTIACRRSTLA